METETARHPEDAVRIGVIDVRDENDDEDARALASWLILHRVYILTGFFGNPYRRRCIVPQSRTRHLVWELARLARATGAEPLYQLIQSASGHQYTHPSFFMCFGFYRDITVPDATPELKESGISLGVDMWFDMLTDDQIQN